MFDGMQVRDLLEAQKRDLKSAVEQASDDEILNRDEDEYVDELFQDYTFECPVIDFEGVYVSDSEVIISSEHFPPDFVTRPGKSYPVHVICYHLPFTGDAELFGYTPSQYSFWFPEVFIEGQEVCFEIVDFRKDMEAVRSEAGRIINSIKTFSESLTKDVEMYGVRRGYIESIIQARKQRLLNNKNVLTSLGVPIRKSVNPIKPTITTNNGSEKGKRTVSSTPQPNKAIEVFISYSHNDQRYRNRLEIQLALLRREGLISIWHDRDINAGTEWKKQIDEHLNNADIILLLVSPDFLASDYCYNHEMERAMEKHSAGEALVIPVILRPCDWHKAPFGKLQALPTDGKPITGRGWRNLDEAFLNVTQGIRNTVKELAKNAESTSSIKESQVSSSRTSLEVRRPSDPSSFPDSISGVSGQAGPRSLLPEAFKRAGDSLLPYATLQVRAAPSRPGLPRSRRVCGLRRLGQWSGGYSDPGQVHRRAE
jgi:TIR domain-containing protein